MRRRRILRIGGWVVVSCALLGGAAAAYPSGPVGLFHDLTDYTKNSDQLIDGQRAERKIDTAIEAAMDRRRLKEELRETIAEGGIGLKAAAVEYLQAIIDEPELMARYRYAIPEGTDEARVAVTLVRDVFATVPLTAREQQGLLDQYHAAYGTRYPLPVPAPVGSRSEAHTSQLRR